MSDAADVGAGCEAWSELLAAWPLGPTAPGEEGALLPEERARLEAHLAACPACRVQSEALAAAHAELLEPQPAPSTEPEEPMSDALRQRTLQAIRAEQAAAATPSVPPAGPRKPARRKAPPPRPGSPLVALGSILSLTLLIAGGVVVIRARRAPTPGTQHLSQLDQALANGREGERLFREWNRVAGQGAPDELALHEGARAHLVHAVEGLQEILAQPQYLDEQGELRPEYAGYEDYLQRWAMLLVDLEKGALLGTRGGG